MYDDCPEYPLEAEIHNLVNQVRIKLSELKFRLTPRLDFEFLSKFVRAKKYDVDKAADAIHRYYEHVHRNLDRIKGIKPSDCHSVIESQAMIVLLNKVEGTKVFYTRAKNWDTKKVSLGELLNFGMLIFEEILTDETAQAHGAIAIVDLKGLGFSHVREFITDMRYTVNMCLDGVPARVSAVHVVNAPRLFWSVHEILLKLLPDKVGKRIHVHNNFDSLQKHISRTKLPCSLGGSLTDEEAVDSEMIRKFMKYDICYDEIWNGDLRIH